MTEGEDRRTRWRDARRRWWAVATILSGLASPAAAQQAMPAPAAAAALVEAAAIEEAHPAMWVVRDADTTIYIFGTFHFLSPRTNWMNGEIRTAFEASQELVLEAMIPEDVARMQQIVFRFAVDRNQRTMSSRLPRWEWLQLRSALGPRIADAMNEAALEPWLFGLSLTNHVGERLGLTPERGADRVLRGLAGERNMLVTPLETVDAQLRIYDRMGISQQMSGLREAIADSANPQNSLMRMLDAWATGDDETLGAVLERKIDDPEVRRPLFTNRNIRWARWIRERMQRPGTVFFAVGIGHLVGQDSVQAQLRQFGLNVERVPRQ